MVSLSMGFELETVAWGAGGCFWSFVYQRSSCACLQPCPASLLLGLRESGGGRGATVVVKDLCRKGYLGCRASRAWGSYGVKRG